MSIQWKKEEVKKKRRKNEQVSKIKFLEKGGWIACIHCPPDHTTKALLGTVLDQQCPRFAILIRKKIRDGEGKGDQIK